MNSSIIPLMAIRMLPPRQDRLAKYVVRSISVDVGGELEACANLYGGFQQSTILTFMRMYTATG